MEANVSAVIKKYWQFAFLALLLGPPIYAQKNPIQMEFANGLIKAHFSSNSGEKEFTLDTRMASTGQDSSATLLSSDSLTLITRKHIRFFDHSCWITNTVKKGRYGLQWDIEVEGEGDDWTAPIETILQWEDGKDKQFWTAWSDNQQEPELAAWQDPFLSAPLKNLSLIYGAEDHLSRNGFVVPIATTLFFAEDLGLSFLESLNDRILDLELHTQSDGSIAYRQLHHRIGKGQKISIRMQILLHEADWRAGMAWMLENYRRFFQPKESLVGMVAGCGAYSSYEGNIDTGRYRKMAFSLNWKASLDFPYMGLFIPPVQNDDERWIKYKQGGVQVGDGYASIHRLNAYAERLGEMGFHTLSYFNVNEFGNGIIYPYKDHAVAEQELWKNPNDFVYQRFKQAMLRPAGALPSWDERPLYSNWEGSIVLDPGDSAYQAFLMDQARLHILKIPFSSGICIDRMDWLRYYNHGADDGISMIGEQKTRSLISSWKSIMEILGPLMHSAHKVIFCNPLDRRIDLMDQVDGIYDEFGYVPSSLNLCAQLAFLKPIIAWTASKENLVPDPDAYFQHHLYLGAFLTVPFPGNDHCIGPDSLAEQFYLDYGPLLQTLKGREWVLVPHVLEVEKELAKANLFMAGRKLILPVVLGGQGKNALVKLRLPFNLLGKEKLRIKVLYPGKQQWRDLSTIKYARLITLPVPLKRGCALVSIE